MLQIDTEALDLRPILITTRERTGASSISPAKDPGLRRADSGYSEGPNGRSARYDWAMEEAHTPKRESIEKFIHHEGTAKDWIVEVLDQPHEPLVRLQARRDDQASAESAKSLDIHTRQVRLTDDELDEATKTLIRRWLSSL